MKRDVIAGLSFARHQLTYKILSYYDKSLAHIIKLIENDTIMTGWTGKLTLNLMIRLLNYSWLLLRF